MGGSPLKIEGLLGMLTIHLQEDNFAKWSFQFQSVLEGYDLFDYFDGTNVCPPKYVVSLESGVTSEITATYRDWIKADKALLSILIATHGDEGIEYDVGSKTAHEAWTHLTDRYATVSRARINHLKTELHTIKKGADSIEKYLLMLKHLKDQLLVVGKSISDNDLIIATLAGLPSEYNMFKMVIVVRESGESSDMVASRQYYQGDNSNRGGSNSSNFYQGESSTTCASRQSYQGDYSNGGVGYVGQFPRSNGTRPSGGHFSQGNLSQQFQAQRNNNGSNGFRFNSRPRYNGHNTGNFNNRSIGGFGFSGSNKGGSTWGNWNGNNGERSHIIPECQICNKMGHTAPNCYCRNEQLPTSNQVIPECQICGKRGHTALNCFHRGNYAFQGTQPSSSLNARTAQSSMKFNNNQAWIMDTGATHHMTGHVGDLNMLTPFEGDQKITVGSGECDAKINLTHKLTLLYQL
ncbi:unnamed protein product [Malus baccata var. baccata]